MSRYFLASAAIEGFRGINNDGDPLVLKFKHDAVNSVHAPNGVGKSSIFEALHFALHGTVPRLEGMQDAEQGASYIVNKFHPAQQATVALVFKSDNGTPDVSITVTRTDDAKQSRANHGLTRSLIANMVAGVADGYEKRLEIYGTGYNCKGQGRTLHLKVGFMGRRWGLGSQF